MELWEVWLFCEWYFQTNTIKQTFSEKFFEENKAYFNKKIPSHLHQIIDFQGILAKDIKDTFQPKQVAILVIKSAELMRTLERENSYFQKYFDKEFLAKVEAFQLLPQKRLYQETVSNSQ